MPNNESIGRFPTPAESVRAFFGKLRAEDAAIEKFHASELGAAAESLLDADVFVCPNCGELGGTPVELRGDECGQTGYVDEFSGCSLCAGRRA